MIVMEGSPATGWRRPAAALVVSIAMMLPLSVAAETPKSKIAVFGLELVDTSLQGELQGGDPDDQTRLELVTAELRRRLDSSARYEVVDTAPAAAEIEAAGTLRTCNGCELAIAQGLGAELALLGWVQKVSNLILNINVQMRDVTSAELVFGGSVDIRGNTDEAWLHGIGYLLEHRLLEE